MVMQSLDVWNEGAKHLPKCAGTTPEERESFSLQLQEGFVDLFRRLHPEAKGQYTFWSTRAGNRPFNKGLRLDYFVGSKCLVEDDEKDGSEVKVIARDSHIEPDQLGSDHCPVILELEINS
jgi:exodeoxyribonuclease-3